MEKIVITGGLGYLGTELCNLYSGESRFKEVIVYDKNFKSASVAQLRKWSIKFIQGDILDKELLSSVLQDADVVYHLAGITDVVYTTEEELGNPEKSDEIANVGIKGSRNVIEAIPKNCKLIFPSTHIIPFLSTKLLTSRPSTRTLLPPCIKSIDIPKDAIS